MSTADWVVSGVEVRTGTVTRIAADSSSLNPGEPEPVRGEVKDEIWNCVIDVSVPSDAADAVVYLPIFSVDYIEPKRGLSATVFRMWLAGYDVAVSRVPGPDFLIIDPANLANAEANHNFEFLEGSYPEDWTWAGADGINAGFMGWQDVYVSGDRSYAPRAATTGFLLFGHNEVGSEGFSFAGYSDARRVDPFLFPPPFLSSFRFAAFDNYGLFATGYADTNDTWTNSKVLVLLMKRRAGNISAGPAQAGFLRHRQRRFYGAPALGTTIG